MVAAQTQLQRAIGLFSNRSAAEQAMYRLRDSGFNMDRISIVARSGDGVKDLSGGEEITPKQSITSQTQENAGTGATTGAVAGGAIGLIGSLGVLAIPGVGAITEVGVLLGNALLGSGIGAASGGLIGALVGRGIPEDRAKHYSDRVHNDNDYLVLLEGSESEVRIAEAVLRENGIRDWNIYHSVPQR
jgi:uncharacterized membrane protein